MTASHSEGAPLTPFIPRARSPLFRIERRCPEIVTTRVTAGSTPIEDEVRAVRQALKQARSDSQVIVWPFVLLLVGPRYLCTQLRG